MHTASAYDCNKSGSDFIHSFIHGAATLHRATLNRATVKRRQFTGRHLTGATIKRSDR